MGDWNRYENMLVLAIKQNVKAYTEMYSRTLVLYRKRTKERKKKKQQNSNSGCQSKSVVVLQMHVHTLAGSQIDMKF